MNSSFKSDIYRFGANLVSKIWSKHFLCTFSCHAVEYVDQRGDKILCCFKAGSRFGHELCLLWDSSGSRCAWQTLGVSLPRVCEHETPRCLPGEKSSSGRRVSSRQASTCNEAWAITWEGQFWAQYDAAIWICPFRDSGLSLREERAASRNWKSYFH